MLDEIMLLWFLLTALSLLLVAVDIRTTPASPVLKWGFILLTAYTGPLGDPLKDGGASVGRHDDHASTGHAGKAQPKGKPPVDLDAESVSNGVLAGMTLPSSVVLEIGLSIAVLGGGP